MRPGFRNIHDRSSLCRQEVTHRRPMISLAELSYNEPPEGRSWQAMEGGMQRKWHASAIRRRLPIEPTRPGPPLQGGSDRALQAVVNPHGADAANLDTQAPRHTLATRLADQGAA